jgi:nitrite reductase/ring-hydroxylating ferredoxin subunit
MMANDNQSRRQFIHAFALLAASATVCGRLRASPVLARITPLVNPSLGILRIKLSDFPILNQTLGSLRLGITPQDSEINEPVGFFWPIIINRSTNNEFFAMSSACTHEGATVATFNPVLRFMECPRHGSRYGIDGRRISGDAQFPLLRYDVEFDGAGTLTVKIPDLGFAIDGTLAQSGAQDRFRLQFLAFPEVEYEVRFHQALGENGIVVPFSTTLDGPANQTVLTGEGLDVQVFVDRGTNNGFYEVGMKFKEV